MRDLIAGHARSACKSHGQFGDALRVAFGLLVAQIHRARPALDCGIVRQPQLGVRTLQVAEEMRVIERDGRLARQRFEEVTPFDVDRDRRAMEHLEHAHQPALGDQRDPGIGHERFGSQKPRSHEARGAALAEIRHQHKTPLEPGLPGVSLAQPQPALLDLTASEAASRGVLERLKAFVEEQDRSGIHGQLRDDLIEQDVERQSDVQVRRDHHVDRAQCFQSL